MRKILAFAAILLFCSAVNAATVSGTAYQWDTLEPLNNVIVEISTTPRQVDITNNARYSFSVPGGSYVLKAQHFDGNVLLYSTEEEITITNDGNFTLDLLLLPTLESEQGLFEQLEEAPEIDATENEQPNGTIDPLLASIVILIVAALFFIAPKIIAERGTGLEAERMGIEEKYSKEGSIYSNETSSDRDLETVVEILRSYGGRMTQKDLRDKVDFGEAKTSLVIAELEEQGRIKKFKKGRGNILVLKE